MSTLTRTTIGLTAAALAVTGVAGAGSAAPTRAVSHTLKLDAHQSASHNVAPNGFLGADVDRNPSTHAIMGYDSISGRFNVTSGVVTIEAALALKGGIITAHLTGKGQGNNFDGKITGGTAKYQGITGTIHTTGKGKVTHITLTYTL